MDYAIDVAVFYDHDTCRFEAGLVVDSDYAEDAPYSLELGQGFFYLDDPLLGETLELCVNLVPNRPSPADTSEETHREWAQDLNAEVRARAATRRDQPRQR